MNSLAFAGVVAGVVTGEVAGVVTGLEAGLILCHAAEWHEVAAHHRETLHLAHLAHLTTVGHLDSSSVKHFSWLGWAVHCNTL